MSLTLRVMIMVTTVVTITDLKDSETRFLSILPNTLEEQ